MARYGLITFRKYGGVARLVAYVTKDLVQEKSVSRCILHFVI